jgi:hypothetical protein
MVTRRVAQRQSLRRRVPLSRVLRARASLKQPNTNQQSRGSPAERAQLGVGAAEIRWRLRERSELSVGSTSQWCNEQALKIAQKRGSAAAKLSKIMARFSSSPG